MTHSTLRVVITKAQTDHRMVYGWAYVATEGGQPAVDWSEEVWPMEDIRQAVHEFIGQRTLKARHKGKVVGEIMDSILFDRDVQKALGIDLGKEGWFVGVRVDDDATLAEVDSGILKMFSVGGMAEKAEADLDDVAQFWSLLRDRAA